MAVKTLLIDESELIDFQLYGLASAYSDSPQFIYNVNQFFDTRFTRCDDLDVLTGDEISYYPVFEWEDEQDQLYYHIIKNNAYTLNPSENLSNLASLFDVAPMLIPQHREYNYLLRVSGGDPDEIPFKENNFIQKITRLDPDKIKTISRLIF